MICLQPHLRVDEQPFLRMGMAVGLGVDRSGRWDPPHFGEIGRTRTGCARSNQGSRTAKAGKGPNGT